MSVKPDELKNAKLKIVRLETTIKILNSDIKLLKATVKAYCKMCIHYRCGIPNMPNWVFKAIDKAKEKYGNDLLKITDNQGLK